MDATVLVVDDEPFIVSAVAEVLEGEGYRVLRAHDGMAALHILRNDGPDLLLTDNMMPGMSGVELIAYLHDHPGLEVPVILMSAVTPVLVPPQTEFLPKPFDLDALIALVADHLGTP